MELTQTSHSWHPVEDYRDDPGSLAHAELRGLAAVWREQREALERLEAWREFNERLEREWAVETGLLERIYHLDRGVTQLLIEHGIDASLIPHSQGAQDPGRVAAVIRDHKEVVQGLFAFVRGDRPLSTSYIKELHAQLLRNQDRVAAVDSLGRATEVELVRGEYKKRPNNPTRGNGSIHEYCPPEQVASEMDRLVELHFGHRTVEPEVEAAWLHHRFTQIHPFQDGNGRVARALASLVFIKHGWFPLVIRDVTSERVSYIGALESADRGDLKPLVHLFAAAQKRAFVQALGISGQVLRHTRVEQVIQATRDEIAQRQRSQISEWEQAKQTARQLQDIAAARLEDISSSLRREMSSLLPAASFEHESVSPGEDRDYYFRWQIVETAKYLEYFANLREYRAWNRLVMRSEAQAEIVLSFHGSGRDFRGVLAVSACFFRKEETEMDTRQIVDLTSLSDEIFQINYREEAEEAAGRFDDWLEEALVRGLEIWRKTL